MKPIRVLIIDDSAFARKVVREVLSRDPAIEVIAIARDGLEGLEKISELRPDVVTLDLIMPELDGLGVLKALKSLWSPKVVIVSVSGSETDLALEALALGAVDVVAKPTAFATDRLYELSSELVLAVKTAAAARIPVLNESTERISLIPPTYLHASARLVVIGTSTGGPQALTELFRQLPAGLPVPIAIALHIPAGYTAPLAARISHMSAIPMTEAYDGQLLIAGHAVIAPGGQHLRIREDRGQFYAEVSHEPRQTLHHPSVDILFESAAEAAGAEAIAVILTGMGNDGQKGAASLRQRGARVLAESEASCVVYGMPRSVIEAGLSTAESLLEEMPQLLVAQIYSSSIELAP